MNDYGYSRTDTGIRCEACGKEFADQGHGRGVDGPVQRSHAKNCPVEPRLYHVPAVCDA